MFFFKKCAFYTGQRINNSVPLNVVHEALVSSFRLLSTSDAILQESDVKNDKMVEYGIKEEKSSKAMRAYLERSQTYNKFMEQEEKEYKSGKRHLANMMGKDLETFTQKDVDEAIAYLFPSGLFVKKTRPFLKPPEEVHPPKKEAEFDETGRPYHFLFYTGKPNFYGFLHKLVNTMKELNTFENTMIRKQLQPDSALAMTSEGFQWLSKDQFEKKFIEELTVDEYRQLIGTLERIVSHPYSYQAKDVIIECRATFTKEIENDTIPKPELQADGRELVTFKESRRKTAMADVAVHSPGTGLITINGYDLAYFEDLHVREQVAKEIAVNTLNQKMRLFTAYSAQQ